MNHSPEYQGTGGGLFAIVFKNLLLTIVTLGIYLPWARTERRKYLWQNVLFDGHRLRYHGTGRELLSGYVKVFGFYLLVFAISFAAGKLGYMEQIAVQVAAGLLLLPLIPLAIYGSRGYLLSRSSLRGIHFGLEPGAGGFLKVFVSGALLTLITLGLYAPVMSNRLSHYMVNRTRYGSLAFRYDGADSAVWWITIKGLLLTVVTLGLYYPWLIAHLARFRAEHTYVGTAEIRLDLSGGDVFWILLISTFGTVLSLGLAFPWIVTYVLSTLLSKVTVVGALQYANVQQGEISGNALGDTFADALDVGLEI